MQLYSSPCLLKSKAQMVGLSRDLPDWLNLGTDLSGQRASLTCSLVPSSQPKAVKILSVCSSVCSFKPLAAELNQNQEQLLARVKMQFGTRCGLVMKSNRSISPALYAKFSFLGCKLTRLCTLVQKNEQLKKILWYIISSFHLKMVMNKYAMTQQKSIMK